MYPSRLLPALAAILIATAPVEAEDSGQGLLLPFGGAPSWVLKPPGGPAPTIDMNFATGQYYGLQPSQLSVTRASPDNEVCNGKLYQFGNNVAPITPCGLWAWEARTNLFLNNNAPATQTITTVATSYYTISFYGTGTLTLSGACTQVMTGSAFPALTQYSCQAATTALVATVTTLGTMQYPQVEVNPNATSTATSFATGPILTSGTAATRAAGQITATVSNNYNSFSLAAKATAFSQLPTVYPAIIEFDNGLNNLAGILLSSSTANSVYLRQYTPPVDSLFSSYSTGVKFIFGATFNSGAYMTSINGITGANSAVTGSQLALSTFRLGSSFNGNTLCDCLISRATVFGSNGLSQPALNYVTSH